VRFYLMATGSLAKAQTTFTDGQLFSTIVFSIGPTSVAAGASLSWSLTATCRSNGNNTCISEGYSDSSPVQDGYDVVIQQSTSATFSGTPTIRQSTTTVGGVASGSFAAPASGGPYFYRAVHDNQSLSDLPEAGNTSNAWRREESNSVTVSLLVDATPPVIAPTVTGTLGTNSWYTSNVGITWTVTDAQSAISSSTGCGPTTVVADTAGVTFTCSATSAGGTNSASVTIKRDASAPNAPTASATPAANAAGWNNTDVTVAFTAAGDNGPSGVLSCTASTLLTAETNGTPVSGTCTDHAGNVSTSSSLTVKIDKTAPGAPVAVVSPPANANGWHNTDVTVSFTAGVETGSGIASCTAPTTLTAETAGTVVSGFCTDNAGNTSPSTDVTVKIDKTAPAAPASNVSPPANANGWHNSDVTVSFTAGLETGSGIASCTAPTTLSAETAGTLVSGTCTDNAGNTSASSDVTVKIDKTAPNPPTTTATPPANAAGWNNTDVTIAFVGAGDNLSGVDTCSADQPFTAETSGTPASGTCTDLAGNVSASTTVTVKIDKTAPTIALNPIADACDVPGLLGWCRGTQTAGFTASDTRSGLAPGYSSPFTKSAATNGTAVAIPSGQVCDVAGNCAASIDAGPFRIDSVAPELTRNTSADGCSPSATTDWCRGTQTAGFMASDATSGLAAGVTSPFTQSTTVNGLAVTIPSGQICDVAGNCADSIDAGPFKIDSVAPEIALTSRLPAANTFGWNNTAVTVAWACTDSTSGPSASSVSATVATEGLNQNATGTCHDVAGNSASDVQGGISIDTTAPAVAVTGVSQGAVYILGAVPAAGCSTSDALSGVNASATLAVTGGVAPGVGTFAAACSGATDTAGNTASASATYTVQFAPAGTSCLGAPAHEVLQPINPDGTSVFKQKSTVPVKFRVCDANGVSIGANVVAAFALVQIFNGAVASDVNEDVQSTTPDTTFRFDPTAQQWIFNTNTKSLLASRTYRYWITLTDGSKIEYQFGLK
jgi:hypothetical protein